MWSTTPAEFDDGDATGVSSLDGRSQSESAFKIMGERVLCSAPSLAYFGDLCANALLRA